MKVFKCLSCNKDFESKKSCKSRTPKYCSTACNGKSNIIDKKKSCLVCGVIFENYKKNQKYCGMSCMGVASRGKYVSEDVKRKQSNSHIGVKYPSSSKENHWNWKGGITNENEATRKSAEYKQWRKLVFERDKYKCIECGDCSGNGHRVELHADHVKPFASYPELRFDVSNGRTLCISCHHKTDTFGGKMLKYASTKD